MHFCQISGKLPNLMIASISGYTVVHLWICCHIVSLPVMSRWYCIIQWWKPYNTKKYPGSLTNK